MDPNINKTLLDIESLCDIENVPLNRWFHLVITVNDNVVQVYIDSKLKKTCVEKNLPIITQGNLYITNFGGFDGMLTKFKIFPTNLTGRDIEKLYLRGPDHKNNLIDALNVFSGAVNVKVKACNKN